MLAAVRRWSSTDAFKLTLIAVTVLVLTAVAWEPGAFAPYQYDDSITPVKDPASQSIDAWIRAIPRTLRPLTKLTYALESSLGATTAPARRIGNAAVFASATALLALLAHAAGLSRGRAAALALLWAIHPVHAEMVLALAGRSVLLSLCFMLASALAVVRGRLSLALACAVLAVLARETAWAWLVACSGLIAWKQGWSRRRVFTGLIAAVTLGGVISLTSGRMRELLAFSWSDPEAGNRLGLQWAAVPRGTFLLFFDPGAFSVDMEFVPRGLVRALYIVAAVALYGAAGWLVLRPRSSEMIRVAALLWLCLVVPVHSVVPKLDPLTARSFAASSTALVVLFAVALGRMRAQGNVVPVAFWSGVGIMLLGLLPLTRDRARLYQDSIALFRDAARQSTTITRPLVNLGTLLAQDGELEEARRTLAQAVQRNPKDRQARERLAAVDVLIETRKLLTSPSRHETVKDYETSDRERDDQ